MHVMERDLLGDDIKRTWRDVVRFAKDGIERGLAEWAKPYGGEVPCNDTEEAVGWCPGASDTPTQ